ncbi:GNAT family N-acetyltransferase [Altererythrobacter sp. H2]|uniref:GNAT family N-acetyltransferase n=1 Tax=Altererythrobacter sp. H2 TaxID=3108391 RepID=UPI002B4BE397|nr:GNAT family N-acetyltransferase [Altererythrobacter sp. H2]WRK95979.1 GNAT family N-acetyltransferase [Altererythrobacter sp. H2]
MTTAPFLVTERLELWLPTADDLAPMFEIVSHPQTNRYLGPAPTMVDHFMRFARNAGSWQLYGYGILMLRRRGGDDSLLGNCGIFHSFRGLGADFDDQPEAGWILSVEAGGHGYAEEAMRAIYAWFDGAHGRCRTVCMIDPANAPSIRLADKLGFEPLRNTEYGGEPIRLFERRP